MNQPLIPVILLNGSVGVGKTSVAHAMSELLQNEEFPHAVIDIDVLRHAYPRPDSDPFHLKLGVRNLSAIWNHYVDAGVSRFIIPSVIESKDEIDHYNEAIPDATITTVRLHASISVTQDRLKNREQDYALDWYLKRAETLTKQLEQDSFEDIVIDTDNKAPREIAKEILEKVSWP